MTEKEYTMYLLDIMKNLINEDIKGAKLYTDLCKRFDKVNPRNFEERQGFYSTLTRREYDVWCKKGRTCSKAEFNRLRITINKTLLKIEREM